MIGRAVGNYRVEKLLGSGGMGAVYLVRHVRLPNTLAALKVLTGEVAPAAARRFAQEAVVAAAIGGERVPRPLDLGRFDDGVPYILMELVEGQTLSDRLAAGPIGIDQVTAIGFQIADTMTVAHARGIIHRDLKPSNVMLVGARVKLLDFGVARAKGDLKLAETHEAAIIGSPGYMSPEAASGIRVDEKSDVFSLGVVLFKMMTGALPFPPATTREALTHLLTAPAPSLPIASPGSPHDLEALVAEMLAKDPAQRPTMAEVRNRLRAPDGSADVVTAAPSPLVPAEIDPLGVTLTHIEDADDLERVRERLERFAEGRMAPRRRRWPPWLALVAAIAIAIAVAAGLLWRPRAAPPLWPRPARQHQLTFRGDVTPLGLSPDGKTLAYRTAAQLVFQNFPQSGVKATELADETVNAMWLPDSSAILVKLRSQPRPMLFPRSGEQPSPIGESVTSFMSWVFPSQSPDGRWRAVWSSTARDIKLQGGDGERTIPLPGSFDFVIAVAWSPDSMDLAVVTRGTDYQLVRVPINGGEVARLAVSRLPMGSLVWGPLGIFYLADRIGGGHDLTFVSVRRRAEPRVVLDRLDVATRLYGANLWLSPDGRQLFYARRTGATDLWRVKVATPESDQPRFEIASLVRDTSTKSGPTISPDAKSVAYAASDGEGTSLFTVPIAGGVPTRVAAVEGTQTRPAWSPDGCSLAFVSHGKSEIAVASVCGGASKQFPAKNLSPDDDRPVWAPGSRVLYLVTPDNDFAALDPERGDITRLALGSTVQFALAPHPAPDGQTLAFFGHGRGSRDSELWLRSPKETRPVGNTGPLLPIGWSSDGAWIYSVAFSSSTPISEIVRVRSTGGPTQPWITLPSERWASECEAGAGGRLVACVSKEDSDLWSIDNLDELTGE